MRLPGAEGEFELTDDMLNSLRVKYPHVDVERELAKINLWLHRNPSRRWSKMLLGIEKWIGKVEAEQRKRGAKLHVVTSDWHKSDAATIAYGEQRGIHARPGETMADYRRRLRSA